MPTKFVCLSNSFKEGGRCIAGVELNDDNTPVKTNDHLKWIRPVSHSVHGEVPTHLVDHINVLDVVELTLDGYPLEKNYQSENVFFRADSINVSGAFNPDNICEFCDNRNNIFGNRNKKISAQEILNLNYSLMLVKADLFEVVTQVFDDNVANPKTRLNFAFRGYNYNFPVTDPVFLYKYRSDTNYLKNCKHLFLCLSITVPWNDWYYKLIATVIPVFGKE